MKLFKVILVLILTFNFFLPVEAVAPLKTRAGVYGPIDPNTNLVLEETNIVVKIRQAAEEYYPQAQVNAIFTLKNNGDTGIYTFGFPPPASPGLDVVTTDFLLFVNRRATPYQTVFLEGTKDTYYAWTMEVGANQKLEINLNYSYYLPLLGWCDFYLPLSLLASFKGNIGRMKVSIDFPFTLEENIILDLNTPNIKMGRNTLYLEEKNFEPFTDLIFRFPNLNLWRNLIDARSMVARSPSSPEMRYLLGVAYLNLGDTRDPFRPVIPFWSEKGKKELEKALSLNPRHQGSYQELARYYELMAKHTKDNIPLALSNYISAMKTVRGGLSIFRNDFALQGQLEKMSTAFRLLLEEYLKDVKEKENETLISLAQLLRQDPANQELSNAILYIFLKKFEYQLYSAVLPSTTLVINLGDSSLERNVSFIFKLKEDKWLQSRIRDLLKDEVARLEKYNFTQYEQVEKDRTSYTLNVFLSGRDPKSLEEERRAIEQEVAKTSKLLNSTWFLSCIAPESFKVQVSSKFLWTNYEWQETPPVNIKDNKTTFDNAIKKEKEEWEKIRLEPAVKEIVMERLNFFSKEAQDFLNLNSSEAPSYRISTLKPIKIISFSGKAPFDENLVTMRPPFPLKIEVVARSYNYLALWWVVVLAMVVGGLITSLVYKFVKVRSRGKP